MGTWPQEGRKEPTTVTSWNFIKGIRTWEEFGIQLLLPDFYKWNQEKKPTERKANGKMSKVISLWKVWAPKPAIATAGPSLDFCYISHKFTFSFFFFLLHTGKCLFLFLFLFFIIMKQSEELALPSPERAPAFTPHPTGFSKPARLGARKRPVQWQRVRGPGKREVSSGWETRWMLESTHTPTEVYIFSKRFFLQGSKDQNRFLKNNKKETPSLVSFDTSPISWLSQCQITCIRLCWAVSFP